MMARNCTGRGPEEVTCACGIYPPRAGIRPATKPRQGHGMRTRSPLPGMRQLREVQPDVIHPGLRTPIRLRPLAPALHAPKRPGEPWPLGLLAYAGRLA